MIRCAVVVPTCRRHELLARCLAALAAQDLPYEQFEVVVADDAASDETREFVSYFAASAPMPLLYVRPATAKGPAAARNAGWQAAAPSADVIAFTDDDCLPESDWLSRGLRDLDSSGAAALAGRVVVPLPARPTDYQRDAAGLAACEFVTANCFCRRAALEAISGFDERFRFAWREDSDLHFTLLEHGFRVEPSAATVVHPVRPASWGISLRQQKKGMFDSLLFKKHPRLYHEKIASLPAEYYAIGLALAVGIGSVALRRRRAGIIAGCLWGLLTGRFFARRLAGNSRAPSHLAEMAVTSALIPPLSLYWRVRGMLRFGVLHR